MTRSQSIESSKSSRRTFLKTTSLAAAGVTLAPFPLFSQPPSNKLNVGIIGVANRGAANLGGLTSENIGALCDIDDNYLGGAAKRFPKADKYHDYRKLLEDKSIDAVAVSTPDHQHAPATVAAMKAGKHVYCEKPLTHTVYEARVVAETAARTGRVTQMGTQIHNHPGQNYRRVVELVTTGAIGAIRECHVWVGKGWGGGDLPKGKPPVPAHIHWDLWLGPAPYRPYHPAYLPANWRRYWDYGGGTLSDMACHFMDLPFWALKLRHPETIEAEGSPVHPHGAAQWTTVKYKFPARGDWPAVDFTWYDGGKRPHYLAEGKVPNWGNGVLFVGDKGMLIADYTRRQLLPESDFAGFEPPPKFIPDGIEHHQEWIQAIKQKGTTSCNFDYAGAFTEAVVLGTVAYRTGEKLQWNAQAFKITNSDKAQGMLHYEYRKGWTL